ncbi:MAG TPA: beta-propeller domain-containing protein [Marmoricola sp.]|nr:beta-propeller domain-containing protein [Marmoricola sp.]
MATIIPALPTLRRLTLAGTALGTAFAAGVVAAGGFASTPPPTERLTPVASKDALHAFDDCRELLDWYLERNLRDVGPYGWRLPPYTVMGDGMTDGVRAPVPGEDLADSGAVAPQAGVRSSVGSGVAAEPGFDGRVGQENSATGTNVQEAGVDEPDVAKTDGRLLVRLAGGNRVVFTDVAGAVPRELGRYRLPDGLTGQELLLVGDHVLVTAATTVVLVDPATDSFSPSDGVDRIAPELRQTTTVLDLDVTDPSSPTLVDEDTYSGTLLSVRQYGDVVRVVTSTPRPDLPWVQPGLQYDEREATARNRDLVRGTTLADWLPRVTDEDGTTTTPDCADVFRPPTGAGDATLGIFGEGVHADVAPEIVALATDSQVVYSSTDRIYVATTRSSSGFWRSAYGRITGQPVPPEPDDVTTQLHSFALEDSRASYVGSGHVTGIVRDRWSLDEQDGRLRVAVSLRGGWGATVENGVAVLVERDGALAQVGHVDGLGPDEDIKAVRWFHDFAVVVTFRQTDPLYTIDFSDPEHPRALGALKISGYSGYLHPIGGGLLLGLGQEATLQGQLLGAQVAVFDISDLTDPRRVDKLSLGQATDLPAVADPRALTWLPGARPGTGTAFTIASDWSRGSGSEPVRFDVGPGGALERRELPALPGAQRALPLDDGRVALVGVEGVRIVGAR